MAAAAAVGVGMVSPAVSAAPEFSRFAVGLLASAAVELIAGTAVVVVAVVVVVVVVVDVVVVVVVDDVVVAMATGLQPGRSISSHS